MTDRETLRKQIKANPQQMFSGLSSEDAATLIEVAHEEGYYVETGEMELNKRGSQERPLILKRQHS
jgi:hypothetical protein